MDAENEVPGEQPDLNNIPPAPMENEAPGEHPDQNNILPAPAPAENEVPAENEAPAENPDENNVPPPHPGIDAGSIGRVDWSPLCDLTEFRPHVSKYGLRRYSPLEWRRAINRCFGAVPSADALDQESRNIIGEISAACDKEQSENTMRLRERSINVRIKQGAVHNFSDDLKREVEQIVQYKMKIKKARESLGVVEKINEECREIRKNRFTEDLVRDEVEEELFQEKGLCQEIRLLYTKSLTELDIQHRILKTCIEEMHALWSDQKETLDLETENIGLSNTSHQISFCHGNAIYDENMSSLQAWENHFDRVFESVQKEIDSSKAIRQKIDSPTLADSARDLKEQDEKVLKALRKRIEEVSGAKRLLEGELDKVLREIAHAESLYSDLEVLGRQLDFNLKVVQTRLENRRRRPGIEKCRDLPQTGLINEVKVISERVTSLQAQMAKISASLGRLYDSRKVLERQIHVKNHSLTLDQERCMLYRDKYPNAAYLLGH